MKLDSKGFELTTSDEPMAALNALDYQMMTARYSQETIRPEIFLLHGLIRMDTRVENYMPQMGDVPFAKLLLGALYDYDASELRAPTVAEELRTSDDEKNSYHVELLERQIVKMMISTIETHLRVPEFDAWVEAVSPGDFAAFDHEK